MDTREQIGAQFWPEHTPDKLESVFRSTLYRLRRDGVKEVVIFENGLYRFNSSYPYRFDVELFNLAYQKAENAVSEKETMSYLEEALKLYRGGFLQGIYDDWITLEREYLRNKYHHLLERLAQAYSSSDLPQRASEMYERLLQEDPYRETAHRELIRCYWQAGDRAAAIKRIERSRRYKLIFEDRVRGFKGSRIQDKKTIT